EAAEKSGGKKVYLEEEPKVAAIGAGMEIFQPSGNMVIDIGGGTTDVAVLSMGGIVTSESIKVGGDKFDHEILQYIKKEYKLLIGERTAEEIKVHVATVFPGARDESLEILLLHGQYSQVQGMNHWKFVAVTWFPVCHEQLPCARMKLKKR